MRIIKRKTTVRVKELLSEAKKRDIENSNARNIIKSLVGCGRIYRSRGGVVELVEY